MSRPKEAMFLTDKTMNQALLHLTITNGISDNKSALCRVMAWRRRGDKPLPEAIVMSFADACMRLQDSFGMMKFQYNATQLPFSSPKSS